MSKVNNISAQQAKTMLEQGAVLIDVREKAEFTQLHIPKANLIPLGGIQANDIKHYKDSPIIIYCQKGLRGRKACEKLAQEDPNTKTFNLEGGIEAWQRAGFDTQQGDTQGLSLEQQINVFIGVMMTVFTVMAFALNIIFGFIALFLLAILILSKFTGYGALIRLIALAPWNR
jgi:rhodanese-related sulfurtransferase